MASGGGPYQPAAQMRAFHQLQEIFGGRLEEAVMWDIVEYNHEWFEP